MPKKENIQQMFDGIAPSYDKLNHVMSLNVDKLWRRHALVAILIAAAIVTPTTDAVTLFIVALPIYLLYEASILVVRVLPARRK